MNYLTLKLVPKLVIKFETMSVLILVELQSYVPIYIFSIWQATL